MTSLTWGLVNRESISRKLEVLWQGRGWRGKAVLPVCGQVPSHRCCLPLLWKARLGQAQVPRNPEEQIKKETQETAAGGNETCLLSWKKKMMKFSITNAY